MSLTTTVRKARSFVGALAASALVLTPVWADDTEIFFADTGGDIFPNVLFIIDTSGSMSNTVYNPDGTSTGKDRLEHVQDAFEILLEDLNNVNVGLMRFSNPGGPILYPVYDIDADVREVGAATVRGSISADDDDAQETASGTMVLNRDELHLTQVTLGLESFTDFITDRDDDAEERVSDGYIWRRSPDLDFYGGGV